MKHRLWIGLLFVVVLSLGVSGCVAPVPAEPQMIVVTATPEPTTEPRPTIKVASNVQIPLRIYRDGDKITGYEYEVYAEALNRAGYDVEVVDVAFAGIFAGLQAEKWDLACSSIYITIEREGQMDFTDPFNEGFEAALSRVDGPVQTLADFKDRVIGTETGTSQAAWLAGMQEAYGPFEIRGYQDAETQYSDLDSGRIDGLTTGYGSAALRVLDHPSLQIIATSEDNFMIGCAVRTDSPIRDEFNAALNEMKEDGTTAALYKEHLGNPAPEGSAVTRVFTEPFVPAK